MQRALTRSSARRRSALLLAVLWLGCGCGATQIRSGRAPGSAAPGYDQRWQSAFLFGAIPGAREHDLDRICPRGWAEIRLEPDVFTGLAGLLTVFLYSPSRVTIVCAAADPQTPPALKAYPVPGR